MSTPTIDTTAATETSKPKLGVDLCDCCGHPTSAVGPLVADGGDTDGFCRYCANQMSRYDIVEADLVEIMRGWYRATVDRGLSKNEIEDTVDAAVQKLETWVAAHPKSTAA